MSTKRPRCAELDESTQTRTTSSAGCRDATLDPALFRQREDWQKGIHIPIAERLRQCEADSEPVKAAELIYHEFLLRREWGETTDWDGLLREFPAYFAQLQQFREADELIESAHPFGTCAATQIGDYEILEEVGHGGMGIVYRAVQVSLGRIVALKMLRSGEFSDSEEIARFLREAKIVAELKHPNIVDIYNVGTVRGQPFIAFEFVEGPSLAKRIDGTPLPIGLAAQIVVSVARAIAEAHERGIVHRDLKPSNVLLTGSDNQSIAKVTDFGASKRIDDEVTKQPTKVLGSPSYMAPEQIDGSVSVRTDVYGLGAILYEALTGRAPFRAATVGETLRQVLETSPARPRSLNTAVPRDLETICLKCLSKEPELRYASAATVADDLTRFLEGKPIKARRPRPLRVAWMWCQRNPVSAGLLTGLAVTAILGVSGIVYQWRRAESALGRAESARQEAIAGEEAARQLVNDLISSSESIFLVGSQSDQLGIEPVLKAAAAHCAVQLEKMPENLNLRGTLTDVYGRLGGLCFKRSSTKEMNEWFDRASALWESAPRGEIDRRQQLPYEAKINYWKGAAATCRVDYAVAVRHFKRACDLWQEAIDGDPTNLRFLREVSQSRRMLLHFAQNKHGREQAFDFLKQQRTEQIGLVAGRPADLLSRKTLAATCLLLAVNRHEEKRQAAVFWKEAHGLYSEVVQAQPDDLMSKRALAECCIQLIDRRPGAPYYRQAVTLLEEVAQKLTPLMIEHSQEEWLEYDMIVTIGQLIACYSKLGDVAAASSVYQTRLEPLSRQLTQHQVSEENALLIATVLGDLAGECRDTGLRDAALGFARKASSVTSRIEVNDVNDLVCASERASLHLSLAGVLNQLDDNVLALQQANCARTILERCCRVAPEPNGFHRRRAAVWERIGKIRWKMNHRDAAIMAFEQAVAAEHLAFEAAPYEPSYRSLLNHRYDRLAYWSGLNRDWSAVMSALHEREKLCRTNDQELLQIAADFADHAKQIGAGRRTLSASEKAFLASFSQEAARIRRVACDLKQSKASGVALIKSGG